VLPDAEPRVAALDAWRRSPQAAEAGFA